MPSKNSITWVNYLDDLSNKEIVPKQLQIEGIDKFINLQQSAFNILSHSIPFIYLLDYTTGKYLVVSNQCQAVVNFSNKKMLDGGIPFVMERYHPADMKVFNEQIFKDRLSILKTIPAEQHKNYIFSFNIRIKNGKGEYISLLQRNSFIESDDNGNPLLSLGVLTNIDQFNDKSPVIQLVEKVDPTSGDVEVLLKNTYYLHEEDKVFSKREKEILLWLGEGLTSKEIADKLFISEHTVINHKRSMHNKSNTQNSAALISFAFKQHLL